MPFFTFEQMEVARSGSIKERFVCVQGRDVDNIKERAEWFGIDFEERGPRGYYRWQEPYQSDMRLFPRWGHSALQLVDWAPWIIVYENGNLVTSPHFRLDLSLEE